MPSFAFSVERKREIALSSAVVRRICVYAASYAAGRHARDRLLQGGRIDAWRKRVKEINVVVAEDESTPVIDAS